MCRDGEIQDYLGDYTAEHIYDWVTKRSGSPSTGITCDLVKELTKKNKNSVVFFGK